MKAEHESHWQMRQSRACVVPLCARLSVTVAATSVLPDEGPPVIPMISTILAAANQGRQIS
eukprot:m.436768 g.436768  ORF g.436768 m.436768 type:complete len:61 (-) comp56777_c0_seq4:65-247(-)